MTKILWVIPATMLVVTGWLIHSVPTIASFDEVKKNHRSSEMVLLDREGRPLHQWRQDSNRRVFAWVSLKETSPAFVQALLKSEDREFFRHGGVDYKSLVASFYQRLVKSSNRGGSTLSMQTVKLAYPSRSWRGLSGKFRQIWAASQIESQWTKEEILEAYLNLVPFRGEYRGLASVSWGLFNKSPRGLTKNEATVLAVLIRSPNALVKDWVKRACWQEPETCSQFPALVSSALQRLGRIPGEDQRALHLAQRLSKEGYQGPTVTTIDRDLQVQIQEIVTSQVRELQEQNVHDAAVLVVENRTGAVWAYVGGSGALSSATYVDGIQSPRQAGSTLKPFLYATAFERELIKPNSWIEDSAVDIVFDRGVYKPQNHDHLFNGWVQAKTALASSLNVPAVKVLKLLNDDSFWNNLRALGIHNLQEPEHYGPALALGVADVTLEDLTQAYRTLAQGGVYSPLHFIKREDQKDERVVFSPKTAARITHILASKENRALGFGMESSLNLESEAAVKTGTSKDMRDNWCVGYNSRFTVGVWVGNFQGDPMWNVMGVTGAAPIWNRVMSWLQERYPAEPFKLSLPKEEPLRPPKTYPFARITYPQNGMILAVDPSIPLKNQKMPLMVEAESKKDLKWRINGQKTVSATDTYLWTPTPGRHTFELLKKNQLAQKVEVIVK
ncbi:MAG: penicillin-binding protein 1C [Bdellovibrio sp.]|nr:penicillin-binding protein 1C [Bdellovibrio sp.]